MSTSKMSPEGTPEIPSPYTQEDGPPEEPRSALSIAISLWRAGRRINLVLAAELMEQGYDVPSLERFHRA